MHRYSIDKKGRETILYILVIVSVALSFMLKTLLSDICIQLANTIKKATWLADFADIIQSTELIPNVIGVPVVYWALSSVFNKYLWKIKPLNKILGVPDMNGIWQGSLHSSHDDMDYEMELDVKQTWTTIQCTSKFKSSQSFSNVAALYSKGIEGNVLYFAFHNQSNDVGTGTQQYDGYNILILDGEKLLGRYFNNRASLKKANKGGNLGTIELRKVKNKV